MEAARSTVRNVALVGPSGAGKTTLLESLLFVGGALTRKGRVTEGNTVGDSSPEARARQMSVEVSAATLEHEGVTFTFLDCPGSVEFVQDVRAALIGADMALVVVEPSVERTVALGPLLHHLDAMELPHAVFINKMDRSEVRYRDLLDALRNQSQRPVVPQQYAIGRGESLVGYIDLVSEEAHGYRDGQPSDAIPLPEEYREREQAARTEMLETLADFDDDLMEILLEEQEPPVAEVTKQLRLSLRSDRVVPVFMGVAERDQGVRRLLKALVEEAPGVRATAERLGLEADGPPLVQVLKTYHLPHAGKLSLARVWRGEVSDGMQLGGNRVGGVFRMFGGQQNSVGSASAGDIVGFGRLEDARTGDVLSNGKDVPDAGLPVATPPQPMFAFALSAKDRNDEIKLSGALAKLTEEDPALSFVHDPETHEAVLWGQGEMHLRVALDRLQSKYNVGVAPRAPQTAFRETIRGKTHVHGRHKKQSGGHGQFGDVKIDIEPRPRGEGFTFESQIVGGAVPKQYIPAVEAGARDYLQKGPLGFPVVDVGIRLVDGQYHTVDSSEMAFKQAVALALKEGLPKCKPVLLEPILSVTVSVPSEYTSKALQLVTQKRGQIQGFAAKDDWSGWDRIDVQLPQAELYDLVMNLRSLSQGVGFFEWQFDHLQEVPDKLTESLIAPQAAS